MLILSKSSMNVNMILEDISLLMVVKKQLYLRKEGLRIGYVCKNVKSQSRYSCVAECHSVPMENPYTESVQVKIIQKELFGKT